MKAKIRLDTLSEVNKFVEVVSRFDEKVELVDDEGHCVSAKSILGALYSFEWTNIYCSCSRDISASIMPWMI